MTQGLRLAGVTAVLLAAIASGAGAAPPPQPCCACIELSGAADPALPAFFCGYFPGAERAAAEARCELFNQTTSDPGLTCVASSPENCGAALADIDIACPNSTAAPTGSATALAALTALLAAGGYCRARRRAS